MSAPIPLARRRTGVNSGGTARRRFSSGAVEAACLADAGAGHQGAVYCCLSARVSFFARPGSPGVPPRRLAVQVRRGEEHEEVTDEPLTGRVCGIDIEQASMVATIGCRQIRIRRGGRPRPAASAPPRRSAGAGGLDAQLAGARGGDGGNGRLLEGAVTGWRPRGSTACWPTRSRSSTCPAGRSGTRPIRWLAACFERGAGHLLLRGHAGVPGDPAAYPVPAGPDRGADPGEAAGGEAAGISRGQAVLVVTDLHGVTGRTSWTT